MNCELIIMYTYAFIKTPEVTLELPQGIKGDLEIVKEKQIAAIVEPEVSIETIEAIIQDDELLKHAYIRHGLVVSETFRQTTILPLRFYHCFADRANLALHLATHQEEYLTQLTNLSGKGEYILKFIRQEPPVQTLATEAKGREYFLAKKQRYQIQQDWKIQQARERVTQAYEDAVIAKGQEQIYLLIDRNAADILYQQLQNWQKYCSSWKLRLSDAIPPYDFLSPQTT